MSSCVSAVGTSTASPCQSKPVSAAAPVAPPTTSDRITAPQNPTAPLLTAGAVALAQIVPGVIELEGGLATATAIGIAARAAMTNPAVGIAVGIAGTETLGYAKSLVHDALSAQPAAQFLTTSAGELDKSIRGGLGIPPSGDH